MNRLSAARLAKLAFRFVLVIAIVNASGLSWSKIEPSTSVQLPFRTRQYGFSHATQR